MGYTNSGWVIRCPLLCRRLLDLESKAKVKKHSGEPFDWYAFAERCPTNSGLVYKVSPCHPPSKCLINLARFRVNLKVFGLSGRCRWSVLFCLQSLYINMSLALYMFILLFIFKRVKSNHLNYDKTSLILDNLKFKNLI